MAFELSYKEIEAQRQATLKLIELALDDLAVIWSMIPDPTDGNIVRMVLEDALTDIIQTYGANVAVHASQQFETLRTANKVTGRFTALSAKVPERDRINGHMRAAIEPIFRGENSRPDLAFMEVQGLVNRMVHEPYRRTMDENTARDGKALGFARVTNSSDPCDFCLMLSSRGPVYGKKSSIHRKDGRKYHSLCSCVAVPYFDAKTEVEGYDPDALLEQWNERESARISRAADKTAKAALAA